MNSPLRYSIDRVADVDWQLFDKKATQTPLTYYLYAIPVASGISNTQLVLTSYNAIEASEHQWATFNKELWSTFMYAADLDQLLDIVAEIFEAIQESDADNPVELAHMFGGTVLSRTMAVPHMPATH